MSNVDNLMDAIMRLTFPEVVELCVRLEQSPEWNELQQMRHERKAVKRNSST